MTTFGRNTERLKGLWPTAMLPADWLDLWRTTFTNRNQEWLALAMERVKLRYSSHQPEIRWFVEAFREVERDVRDSQRTTEAPTDREAEREADREECERGHRRMLDDLNALDPFTRWELVDRLRTGPLREIVAGLNHDPNQWSRFAVGMVWAANELDKPGVRERVLAERDRK